MTPCPCLQVPDNEVWSMLRLGALIRPDWHVVDVGAGDGEPYTHLFMHELGPRGSITSFEPGPQFVKLQNHPCRAVSKARLEFNCAGLDDHASKRRVKYYQFWTLVDAADESRNFCHKADTTPFEVSFSTIDDWGLRVDFLKLDVDGYEFKILRGATSTLQRCRPLILLELSKFTLENLGERVEDMLAWLLAIGYVLRFPPDDVVTTVRSALDRIPPPTDTVNVFAEFPW